MSSFFQQLLSMNLGPIGQIAGGEKGADPLGQQSIDNFKDGKIFDRATWTGMAHNATGDIPIIGPQLLNAVDKHIGDPGWNGAPGSLTGPQAKYNDLETGGPNAGQPQQAPQVTPGAQGQAMTPDQVNALRAWIAQGQQPVH